MFQLTALLVKGNIISLENACCGSEHKCFGALIAHFIIDLFTVSKHMKIAKS